MIKKSSWTWLFLSMVSMSQMSIDSAAQTRAQSEQQVTITGQVVDSDNLPVSGISVSVFRGSERLDVYKTKQDGNYALKFSPGGSITAVVYVGLDYCPCAILNVSGKARHTITKVLYKKLPNTQCPNYGEVTATLNYFEAHPKAFSEERVMYADLLDKMRPKQLPGVLKQEPLLAQLPSRNFVIPEGTLLVVELNTDISTNTTQKEQPFSVTVREPFEYEGALISGSISSVKRENQSPDSERVSLVFNFDTIRMFDGQIFGFTGSIEELEPVGQKGGKGPSIGAATGSIIGAIAGGGQGAAMAGGGKSAAMGATLGMDSSAVLMSGTKMKIRSFGPSR